MDEVMVEVGYKEIIRIDKGDYVTPILNVALSTPFYFVNLEAFAGSSCVPINDQK